MSTVQLRRELVAGDFVSTGVYLYTEHMKDVQETVLSVDEVTTQKIRETVLLNKEFLKKVKVKKRKLIGEDDKEDENQEVEQMSDPSKLFNLEVNFFSEDPLFPDETTVFPYTLAENEKDLEERLQNFEQRVVKKRNIVEDPTLV